MRGTPPREDRLGEHRGIIPACAGNTTPRCRGSSPAGDHPRVCGEHPRRRASWHFSAGSSPRVRGTLPAGPARERLPGIIPACAGNTTIDNDGILRCGDHPRVCGEHSPRLKVGTEYEGSSPRVRGTRATLNYLVTGIGIIPACAGNTIWLTRAPNTARDHPRVCGEHRMVGRGGVSYWGSSPRVRGTLAERHGVAAGLGIIPACAGNTSSITTASPTSRDHPRVCGEHRRARLACVIALGSSPRVRGTPACSRRTRSRTGIIPACAGNTYAAIGKTTIWWDHPRVCGEHRHRQRLDTGERGSSPRVRGTRSDQVAGRVRMGIIPACAGNTADLWWH